MFGFNNSTPRNDHYQSTRSLVLQALEAIEVTSFALRHEVTPTPSPSTTRRSRTSPAALQRSSG
jgi:hypothetical protein